MYKILIYFLPFILNAANLRGQPPDDYIIEITEERNVEEEAVAEGMPKMDNEHCKLFGDGMKGMKMLLRQSANKFDLLSIFKNVKSSEKAKENERAKGVKIVGPSELHRFIEALEGQNVRNALQFNIMHGVKEEQRLTMDFAEMPTELKGLLKDLYYMEWINLIEQNEIIYQQNEGKVEKIGKITRKVTNRLMPPQQIVNGIGKVGNLAQKIGAGHLKPPENVQRKFKEIGGTVQRASQNFIAMFADKNWEEKYFADIFFLFIFYRLHKLAINIIAHLLDWEQLLNGAYFWRMFSVELDGTKYLAKQKAMEQTAEKLLHELAEKWANREGFMQQMHLFEENERKNVEMKFEVSVERAEPRMFVREFSLSLSEARDTKRAISSALRADHFDHCSSVDDLRCCFRRSADKSPIELNDSQLESAKGRRDSIYTLAFFMALCGDKNLTETGECTENGTTLAKTDKLFVSELRMDKIGKIFGEEIAGQSFYSRLSADQKLTEKVMDRLKIYYAHHSFGLIADAIALVLKKYAPSGAAEKECLEREKANLDSLFNTFKRDIEMDCLDEKSFKLLLKFQRCHPRSKSAESRENLREIVTAQIVGRTRKWQREGEALIAWVLAKATRVMVQFVRQFVVEHEHGRALSPYIFTGPVPAIGENESIGVKIIDKYFSK